MKTLTADNHPELLKDAITLLKSDFVALYSRMGYDKQEAGLSWHSLRTSAKGHELRKQLTPSYLGSQATSFIGNVEEEAQIRMGKKSKKEKKKEDWQDDPNHEGSKAFNESNKEHMLSGNKEERAEKLIKSGLIKASELAKQGGFSIPYAYVMLKKYK